MTNVNQLLTKAKILFFQMSTKDIGTICSPIRNLNDLFDISSTCLTDRFQSSQLIPRYTSPRQKILLCHDMKGGYLEDKYTHIDSIKLKSYFIF